MLLGFIYDLSTSASILLIICLLSVCIFEAINGFHDTANAVATVIYTKTLKPQVAVVWSGFCNFLGVYWGGIAVAMGIVKLIPITDLAAQPLGENVALVMAILITAIAWNLGTWYFGIPCSSSHTLIGALLGSGFAFWSIHGGSGVNWHKAEEIGLSLLISPLFGFSLAIGLMYLLRQLVKNKTIFKEPDSKKAPPIWIRGILVLTCTLVSFFHGSNDGQKGVGLLLVVLMAFMPLNFALNHDQFNAEKYRGHFSTLQTALGSSSTELSAKVASLTSRLDSMDRADKVTIFTFRKDLKALNDNLAGAVSGKILTGEAAKTVSAEIRELKKAYEFAPTWVIVLISICLGVGTMVGWKRIVVTIGEKIGKSHLTYAQGASAELCAAATIGVATYTGQPVSTTHVLSSAIAGTMVAEGGTKNLQKKTIQNIALAWLLTLPVTFAAGYFLYFIFRLFA